MPEKPGQKRITGSSLRTAAWLMEASLTGPTLYRTAVKQLGLTELHGQDVPRHAAPYLPLHLNPAARAPAAEPGEADHE